MELIRFARVNRHALNSKFMKDYLEAENTEHLPGWVWEGVKRHYREELRRREEIELVRRAYKERQAKLSEL